MRTSILLVAGALVIGGCVALVGCGDSSSSVWPAPASLKEGVNLLDVKDPASGMSAAFMKNGRVVYVQTRVGALKPDIYRQTAPNEPPNETDMRFVDQDGKTLYVQRGGDSYVDTSWEKDIVAARAPIADVAQRDADFELAKEAAYALALALPAGFEHHVHHLGVYAAAPTPASTFAEMKAKGESGYSGGSWSSVNGAFTQLWSHRICFAWVCPAWHSATVTYDGNGAFVVSSCNHGNCGSSGNSYQCTSSGASAGSITGEGWSSKGVSAGCLTGYNWDTPPGHECNDDAAYELFQTKVGTPNTPWGGQWNFNVGWNNNYACDCNINGCSGDWQRPSCP